MNTVFPPPSDLFDCPAAAVSVSLFPLPGAHYCTGWEEGKKETVLSTCNTRDLARKGTALEKYSWWTLLLPHTKSFPFRLEGYQHAWNPSALYRWPTPFKGRKLRVRWLYQSRWAQKTLNQCDQLAAANRQRCTNYFIKAVNSRTPDILFLGKICPTPFSVSLHWDSSWFIRLSDQAPVSPGCLSTQHLTLRSFLSFPKTLLTTGNFSADFQTDNTGQRGAPHRQGQALLRVPVSSGIWVWASKLKNKTFKGFINSEWPYYHTFVTVLLRFYCQVMLHENRLMKPLRGEFRTEIPQAMWKG